VTSGHLEILADFAARIRVGIDPEQMLRTALQCATVSLEIDRSLAMALDLSSGSRKYLEHSGVDDPESEPLLESLEALCRLHDPLPIDNTLVLAETANDHDPLLLSPKLREQGVAGVAAMIIDDPHWHRLYLLVLLRERDKGFEPEAVAFLNAMAHLLAMAIEQQRSIEQRNLGLEQVMQIKHELEATVDTLPQLICALDRDARLTRVNRTLETWGLGSIRAVRGLSVHELLHPECDGPDCTLLTRFEGAWQNLAEGESTTWELEDRQLERDLRITLERAVKLTYRSLNSESHAVMVVEDIGEHRQLERTRENFRRELQTRLAERTGQLTAANEELRRLSAQRLSWQEDERKRIALELHDGLGQTMSEIKFRVEGLMQDLRGHAAPPDAEHFTRIGQIVERLRQGIDEVRRIAMDLRPSTLDDLGLLPTISWFCREFRRTYGDLQLEPEIDVAEASIPAPLKIVIFRILQEALHNIAKHARAGRIQLVLEGGEEHLRLRIQDDGRGFQIPTDNDKVHGFGLSNMRQRAELSGGALTIRSLPGEGTAVEARWPLGGEVVTVAD